MFLSQGQSTSRRCSIELSNWTSTTLFEVSCTSSQETASTLQQTTESEDGHTQKQGTDQAAGREGERERGKKKKAEHSPGDLQNAETKSRLWNESGFCCRVDSPGLLRHSLDSGDKVRAARAARRALRDRMTRIQLRGKSGDLRSEKSGQRTEHSRKECQGRAIRPGADARLLTILFVSFFCALTVFQSICGTSRLPETTGPSNRAVDFSLFLVCIFPQPPHPRFVLLSSRDGCVLYPHRRDISCVDSVRGTSLRPFSSTSRFTRFLLFAFACIFAFCLGI